MDPLKSELMMDPKPWGGIEIRSHDGPKNHRNQDPWTPKKHRIPLYVYTNVFGPEYYICSPRNVIGDRIVRRASL